jgi:hypothetical protein
MSDLERLTKAFHTMDDEGKRFVLALALRQAEKYPAKPRPHLSLVAGPTRGPAGGDRRRQAV